MCFLSSDDFGLYATVGHVLNTHDLLNFIIQKRQTRDKHSHHDSDEHADLTAKLLSDTGLELLHKETV